MLWSTYEDCRRDDESLESNRRACRKGEALACLRHRKLLAREPPTEARFDITTSFCKVIDLFSGY